MVNYSDKVAAEKPFSVRNKNFEPSIERDCGTAPSTPVQENWSKDLTPHERLFKHATMSSARRKAVHPVPKECPKDSLDFAMEAVFSPLQAFPEKTDPYLHVRLDQSFIDFPINR